MTANKPGDPLTLNRLYGRSVGKPLRKGQQALVDDLLPRIAVPLEGPVTAERLFGSDRPLHFEIGFGGGEHMAGRADMLPDHGFIGAEPFLNGVAQALTHIDGDNGANAPLGNVRIHHGDALEVLARIPDGARLIDNPVSAAPGFSLGNVHVMAGVPTIFEAMLAGLLPTLTGGAPLLSQSVRVMRGEGEIAGLFGELAAKFPDLSMGSYPFIQAGTMGTNLVIRGTDPAQIDTAMLRLATLFPADS